MIYRHYKGGLYNTIGYATKFSKKFPIKKVVRTFTARFTEAKNPSQYEIVVSEIVDKKHGSTYFTYVTDFIKGTQILYKDLNGEYWLRPVDMFYGRLEDNTKRFTKLEDDEIFSLVVYKSNK